MAELESKPKRLAKKRTKKHVQLTLDQARKPTGHGGWRPGAGRPRGRTKVAHEKREHVAPSHPQHVTLRIVSGLGSLRAARRVAVVRDAIRRAQRDSFRIVHFNVLGNHLHLIVETPSAKARARGVQGLEIRIARRLNPLLGRRGALFADRYHTRALKTPREVRNAIRYVLNNARHHEVEAGMLMERDWVDPCSSGAWFDDWKHPMRGDAPWKRDLLAMPRPTVAPTVWLLTSGWKRHGLIAFDEVPGDRHVHEEVRSRAARIGH